ncbi:spheroidene monooxygenase [Cyclobacterium sp. 1_MG-2023]|uniref:spheroidene monooxygenase n=1 Tax=Cyclobacterium sp. 1_MG-2023 TaxID=3062681 RepID=UPI0026E453AF|nr:spheroidene monooxygenase [Cyclobacterium sp. 1_MG-2023]MDO6436264.1 spheroidene monooxygenase [Cyclobacterium sp. 1_MG-2023]
MNENKEIVSITFFQYPKRNRWWAFNQMQLAISPLKKVQGKKFFKLMGTGGGFGFSLKPDFSTYALLMVWEDVEAARNFNLSEAYLRFNQQCISNFTYWMRCIQSHGTWYGKEPFNPSHEKTDGPIMVITRARVKLHKVFRFLKYTPNTSRSAEKASGLIFTKGIGEWPIIEQATFSYWNSQAQMEDYAYGTAHKEVIKKVKIEKWYKEELFARFIPIEINKIPESQT